MLNLNVRQCVFTYSHCSDNQHLSDSLGVCIGQGTYAKVHEATVTSTKPGKTLQKGSVVAVKVALGENSSTEAWKREESILQWLNERQESEGYAKTFLLVRVCMCVDRVLIAHGSRRYVVRLIETLENKEIGRVFVLERLYLTLREVFDHLSKTNTKAQVTMDFVRYFTKKLMQAASCEHAFLCRITRFFKLY